MNGNTVPIDLLSKECTFFTLSCISGKLDWNASSWIAHALFIPTNDFDISVANSFVKESKSSKLYVNNVDIIEASYILLNPAAISSLNCSASNLFWVNVLSLFIFPLSAATILSVSSSFITLFNSFCDLDSEIGVIYIDVFTSPKKYKSLNNSGNVHIRGSVDIKKLLAYLFTFDIISKWSILDASIPEGAISSFIVLLFKSPGSSCLFNCLSLSSSSWFFFDFFISFFSSFLGFV